MAAAKARDHFDKLAKKRMEEGGKKGGSKGVEKMPHPSPAKARDEAGKAFGVSGRMVDSLPTPQAVATRRSTAA